MTFEDRGFLLHRGCLAKAQVAELTSDFSEPGKGAGDRRALTRSKGLQALVESAFGLSTSLFAGVRPKVLRCILFDKNPATSCK